DGEELAVDVEQGNLFAPYVDQSGLPRLDLVSLCNLHKVGHPCFSQASCYGLNARPTRWMAHQAADDLATLYLRRPLGREGESGHPRTAVVDLCLSELIHFCCGLLQPIWHLHLAIHGCRDREVLLRLSTIARPLVKLAEAKMAVGNERTHAARLSERQRLAVVAFSVLGAACRPNLTVEAEGMGLVSPSPQPPGERQGLPSVAGRLVDPPC